MRGFVTSYNPFVSGTRPRTFFGPRKAMMTRAIRTGNGGKSLNPDFFKS